MGCFSWMYADNQEENVKISGDKFTLLFPDGRRWTDDKYDGYGHISHPETKILVDVFALLALWNRNLIINNMVKEQASELAVGEIGYSLIDDFYNKSIDDKIFVDKIEDGDPLYTNTLRIIGINADSKLIHNEQYKPLKFVEDDSLSYDDVEASKDDPNQGGIFEKDDIIGYCDYCGAEIHEYDGYVDGEHGLYCCESCRDAGEPSEDNFDEDAWEDEYYNSDDEE